MREGIGESKTFGKDLERIFCLEDGEENVVAAEVVSTGLENGITGEEECDRGGEMGANGA